MNVTIDNPTDFPAALIAGNDTAFKLASAFATAGEELYVVGGAVRDALLGHADLDLDFATSARPPRTVEILEGLGVGSVYRVGEKYGTIGLATSGGNIEVTTYRARETYPPGSRKPEVEFGQTLLDDLSRRDFTINAIAQDPQSGEIIDPLGGREDLRRGEIRAVGDPGARFREDPLRLLRAVRFAARFSFTIEGQTWSAMLDHAPALATISRERVRDEYTRLLTGPNAPLALELLLDAGILPFSAPALLELTRMPDHGPRHPLSLWDHTMNVVSGVEPDLIVRWAALLHDVAKPATRTHEANGRPRFFHHEEIGAQIARDLLTDLRYSNDQVDAVALLVGTHMQLHSYNPEWSDGAVRRLMVRMGPLLQPAIMLARADAAGHSLTGESENSPKFDELERRIAELSQEQDARLTSPLSGEDLMARYGRGPGPWIRTVKAAICDALLEGNLDPGDRDGAWLIADAVVERDA